MKSPILLSLLLVFAQTFAQKPVRVLSPDKKLAFTFRLRPSAPAYRVTYNGQPIVDESVLGMDLGDGRFQENLAAGKTAISNGADDYELLFGKTKQVHARFTEAAIPLVERHKPFRAVTLRVRVFNDGLAFRYEFVQGRDSLIIRNELTTFRLHGDPATQALLLPNYTTSHEGRYSHLALSQLPADTLIDMPALFSFPDHVYLALTEAALIHYAGMYLGHAGDGTLAARLSPLPGQNEIKVRATWPHHTPWRVFLVGTIGTLIESNIVTTLNERPQMEFASWLRPGKTTFPWWNGNVTPDTLNAPGNNFVTAQYYIDFCARAGIAYHSVVEYGLHQWYTDDGVGFQPGPHADVTQPVPGLDMKKVCDYAATKGVGIRVWVHWAALYPQLDSAFTVFEKWGIKGMMVDFMDRDDQQMVNIQEEILRKAAQHHLHIQFHGAYKPTGLNRTYPNEMTREGTLNYEADKWNPQGIGPDHDLDIVFTRMLAGSTDYHLGGFRAVPPQNFRTQYTRPLVLGTRAHMLAMYVVLENYLQMVCDYPAAYEGQDGFALLTRIPTIWDETRVVSAEVGSYIAIARRSGQEWYVGVLTNTTGRKLVLPLNFLGAKGYKMQLCTDRPGADPNALSWQEAEKNGKDSVEVNLPPGGGAVLHFTAD